MSSSKTGRITDFRNGVGSPTCNAKEITVLQAEAFLVAPGRKQKEEAIQYRCPRSWNLPCIACGKPNCRGPNLGPQKDRAEAARNSGSPLRSDRSVRSRCTKVDCNRSRLRHRFVRKRELCIWPLFTLERTAGQDPRNGDFSELYAFDDGQTSSQNGG
jgi:hypothetical protein